MSRSSEVSKDNQPEAASLEELRLRKSSPKPDGRDAYEQLKQFVVSRLAPSIESLEEGSDSITLRAAFVERLDELLAGERILLKKSERRRLIEDIFP